MQINIDTDTKRHRYMIKPSEIQQKTRFAEVRKPPLKTFFSEGFNFVVNPFPNPPNKKPPQLTLQGLL
jgi:hypothetical protein